MMTIATAQNVARAAMPKRHAGLTLCFCGRPAGGRELAALGPDQAAWIDPYTGTIVQVADFERPGDDHRPPVAWFDEVCPHLREVAP